LNDLKKKKKKV